MIKKKFMIVFFVFLVLIGLFYTAAYMILINSNIQNIADNELDQTRKLVYVTYFSEPTRLIELSENMMMSDYFQERINEDDFVMVSHLMEDTFINGPEITLLVDNNDNIIITNFDSNNSDFFMDDLVNEVVENKNIISTTEKVNIDLMLSYSEELYWNSLVKEVTEYQNQQIYNDDMLVHFVLIPILDDEDNVDYVLVHGIILNKNERMINALKSYGIQSAIYADDVAVASSFFTDRNNMYTGIKMDEETYDKVLMGEEFTSNERFFFDEQYIMYLPLKNYDNDVIGSIVFSIDKSKYSYMKTFFGPLNIFVIALFLLLIGIGGASLMAYYFTKKFMKPMLRSFAEIIEGISKEEGSISDKIRKE